MAYVKGELVVAVSLTLAGVGSAVLAEGIKFLYGQAGELLKRWRERRNAAEGAAPPAASASRAPTQLPAIFAGQVVLSSVNDETLQTLSKELGDLKRALEPYAEGDEPIAE